MLERRSLGEKLSFILLFFGFLAAIFCLSWVHQMWVNRQHLTAARLFNDLADDVIQATVQNAVERGATNVFLSSQGAPPPELVVKIENARKLGDAAFLKEVQLFSKLEALQGINIRLELAEKNLKEIRGRFETLRQKVDSDLRSGQRSVVSKEWVETATAMIEAQTEARLAAVFPVTVNESAIVVNLQIKHLLWTAAEFSGRERALLGSFVASSKPISPESLQNIHSWRFMVERALKEVVEYRSSLEKNPVFVKALGQLELEFFGKWQKRRLEVLLAATEGHYPLTGAQWMTEATQAIESILAVSDVVSKELASRIVRDERWAWGKAGGAGFLFLVLLGVLGGSVWYLRTRVNERVNFLIECMKESGDQARLASEQVAAAAQALSEANVEQAAAIVETAASVTEVTSMIKNTAANAEESTVMATKANESAVLGAASAGEMSKAMVAIEKSYELITQQMAAGNAEINEIGKLIQTIGDKTKVINDIVFQTKLLSFNASVEAARAGEHGREFAIVAEEVGKLAAMSGAAAQEIRTLLDESIKKVQGMVAQSRQRVEQVTALGKSTVGDGVKSTDKVTA
ncbi:methyl-accepting chemotaxis protein, partial [Bdellovibrionota bacterium FG-1]